MPEPADEPPSEPTRRKPSNHAADGWMGPDVYMDPEPTIDPPSDSLAAYIAGVLSTFTPLDQQHPAGCLAMAYAVLDALAEWAPDDA